MNIIKPGQPVWVVWSPITGSHQIAREIVKDVCTGDGRVYAPEHGDDCFIRWNRRGSWVKHDTVFASETPAKLELARRLRAEAAVLLKRADDVEASAV